MRKYLIFVLLAAAAAIVQGCDSENLETCYGEFTECLAKCDDALQAAIEDSKACEENCDAELEKALEACQDVAEHLACTVEAMQAHPPCMAGCRLLLDQAIQENESCEKACGDAYLECIS